VRRQYEIHLADQLDVPSVPHKAMLVLLHQLPSSQQHLLVLNFSDEDVMGTIRSELLVPQSSVNDMFGGWEGQAVVDELNSFHVTLGSFEGFSLLIQPPIGPLSEAEAREEAAGPPTGVHAVVPAR
jgi:hypothetical protein